MMTPISEMNVLDAIDHGIIHGFYCQHCRDRKDKTNVFYEICPMIYVFLCPICAFTLKGQIRKDLEQIREEIPKCPNNYKGERNEQ